MFCVTGEVKMYSIKLKAVRWNLDQKIHYYITRHIYFQVWTTPCLHDISWYIFFKTQVPQYDHKESPIIC